MRDGVGGTRTSEPVITAHGTRAPVTDLSHMSPLDELHDRACRGDLDDKALTRELSGLQRRYGPYHLDNLVAWHNPSWVDKDGRAFPALTRFVADIRDEAGKDAGSLIYNFIRDDQGELVATNERTELHKDCIGRGFATTFSASTEDYFRRSGVDRIELVATRLNADDPLDGGVAWAKSGYDWNPDPEKLAKSVINMRARIDSLLGGEIGPLTPGDIALLENMRTRFDGPVAGFPSPRELVLLAGDNPRLGEELMKGSTWHGMKNL
ncbi:hypothetical protein [Nocardia paucivorans]|uniref:hypothetical protein n=1 Tax=Nocardia paucivorans TaxID=114259 RepID=UPI000303BDEE|nr:hypothetical protein [Nocardia paucivorans]